MGQHEVTFPNMLDRNKALCSSHHGPGSQTGHKAVSGVRVWLVSEDLVNPDFQFWVALAAIIRDDPLPIGELHRHGFDAETWVGFVLAGGERDDRDRRPLVEQLHQVVLGRHVLDHEDPVEALVQVDHPVHDLVRQKPACLDPQRLPIPVRVNQQHEVHRSIVLLLPAHREVDADVDLAARWDLPDRVDGGLALAAGLALLDPLALESGGRIVDRLTHELDHRLERAEFHLAGLDARERPRLGPDARAVSADDWVLVRFEPRILGQRVEQVIRVQGVPDPGDTPARSHAAGERLQVSLQGARAHVGRVGVVVGQDVVEDEAVDARALCVGALAERVDRRILGQHGPLDRDLLAVPRVARIGHEVWEHLVQLVRVQDVARDLIRVLDRSLGGLGDDREPQA